MFFHSLLITKQNEMKPKNKQNIHNFIKAVELIEK